MIDSAFETALRSPDAVEELRQLAQCRLDQGQARDAVLADFEAVRRQLRASRREEDEDALLDVMDILVGWCSPHMSFEHDPTQQ